MTAAKKRQRDDLDAKDRRIDDLIAEAEQSIASLVGVVEEMKRRTAAQQQISERERGGF